MKSSRSPHELIDPTSTPEADLLAELTALPRRAPSARGRLRTSAAIALAAVSVFAYHAALVAATLFFLGSAATTFRSIGSTPSWGLTVLLGSAYVFAGWGALFVFIKPWLGPKYRTVSLYPMDREREPRFFAFVDAIADHIGAAHPDSIRLSLDVEAAVHRERIGEQGERGRVLTIGLPLLRGISLPTWAGIVAHELGHFATRRARAGARLLHFYHEEFCGSLERPDAWDEALARLGRQHPWGIVRVKARVLRLFVVVGRGLQSFCAFLAAPSMRLLARRMEFEADAVQTQLCGRDSIERTALEIARVTIAQARALSDLDQLWLTGRLCDDLSALIAHSANELRDEEEPIDLLDWDAFRRSPDHPSLERRIAAARLAGAGNTGWGAPRDPSHDRTRADALLSNATSVGVSLSARYYQHSMASQIEPKFRLSAERLATELDEERRAREAIIDVVGALPLDTYELFLREPSRETPDLEAARDAWYAQVEAAIPVLARREEAEGRVLQSSWGLVLQRAGVDVPARALDLPTTDPDGLEEIRSEAEIEVEATDLALEPLADALARYWRAHPEPAAEARAQAAAAEDRYRAASDALVATWPRVRRLRRNYRLARAIHDLAPGLTNDAVDRTRHELEETLRLDMEALLASLTEVEFPFPHAKANLSIAQYLDYHPWEDSNSARTFERADRLGPRLYSLQERLLAHRWWLRAGSESSSFESNHASREVTQEA